MIDVKKSNASSFWLLAPLTIFHRRLVKLQRRWFGWVAFAKEPPSRLPIGAVLEVVHQIDSALDACIGKFANLFAIEAVPSASAEFPVELEDEARMGEVEEGVAHVAGVVVVDGQVQEIDVLPVALSDLVQQHLLTVLVWNVSDHQRGPPVGLDLSGLRCTWLGTIRNYCTSSPERFLRLRWKLCC